MGGEGVGVARELGERAYVSRGSWGGGMQQFNKLSEKDKLLCSEYYKIDPEIDLIVGQTLFEETMFTYYYRNLIVFFVKHSI